MICTEIYVRKADDGKGGAGYETMIVTGEIVENLGTSKFIPVVRQPVGTLLRPKCVCTRFYANLSDDGTFDEQFELLLRELHNEPALKKPPLGNNPFAKKPSGTEIPNSIPGKMPKLPAVDADVVVFYENAMEITRAGDLTAWRRLVREAKQSIPTKLNTWRITHEKTCRENNINFPDFAAEGLSAFSPLIAIAIAAVESGRARFVNQQSVLDEILDPKDWQRGGSVPIVMLPEAGVFTFQALHGAIAIQTGQFGLAIGLARTPIREYLNNEPQPLFNNSRLIGWPYSLGENCTTAWDFLLSLSTRWNWLSQPFGDNEEFQAAICAYYMALNVLELSDIVSRNQTNMLETKYRVDLKVPACFGYENNRVISRAYRLLLANPNQTVLLWRSFGVSRKQMEAAWRAWMTHTTEFSNNVYQMRSLRRALPHINLFRDLPNTE